MGKTEARGYAEGETGGVSRKNGNGGGQGRERRRKERERVGLSI